MRGRKPKPTFLKLVSGNPGHRPLNVDEPEPEGDLRDPPNWFSPAQRIIWDRIIRDAPRGLLRRLDSALLETFVVAKSIHQHAAEQVTKIGVLCKDPDGNPMRNPYVSIANQQAQVLHKCISEMGFSPSSRSRVQVPRKTRSGKFSKLRALKIDG